MADTEFQTVHGFVILTAIRRTGLPAEIQPWVFGFNGLIVAMMIASGVLHAWLPAGSLEPASLVGLGIATLGNLALAVWLSTLPPMLHTRLEVTGQRIQLSEHLGELEPDEPFVRYPPDQRIIGVRLRHWSLADIEAIAATPGGMQLQLADRRTVEIPMPACRAETRAHLIERTREVLERFHDGVQGTTADAASQRRRVEAMLDT